MAESAAFDRSSVTIVLVDDHQLLRAGLKTLLESKPQFEVIGETDNGRHAIAMVEKLKPKLVVMDITMPDLNGIEATRSIANAGDEPPKVIALSAYSDQTSILAMLNAGASAYLLKSSAIEELVNAIQAVLTDQIYLGSGIEGVVERAGLDDSHRESAFVVLSAREREVLQLLAEGRAMKAAAMRLGVSVKTVETHRRNIMSKLNLYSIAELTRYAIRSGVSSLDA